MFSNRIPPRATTMLRLHLLATLAARQLIVTQLMVIDALLALLRRFQREPQRSPQP